MTERKTKMHRTGTHLWAAGKGALCVFLCLALMLGGGALAENSERPLTVYAHDGRVTMVDGSWSQDLITGFEGASRVVEQALELLAPGEQPHLEPWRVLTDACDNRYYVFQQMHSNTTVLGGAVKVMTDPAGNMLGLTSSLMPTPAGEEDAAQITAAEAEAVVLEHAMQTQHQALSVVDGLTSRIILPLLLQINAETEEAEGSRTVWVVYTNNPDAAQSRPYLAHYVAMNGEYLYSLPTFMPGDEAGATGFDASYIFSSMEPVEYTGYVDLSTGGEKEITVSLMRDTRTGMYCLGNLERRIVVADCWEFMYNGGRVVPEYSLDNLEWDQVGLLSLYNYCRAYDYYKAIGWTGGDGLNTPILILNNYCDETHQPVDNAAYVGGYLGWQIFLASQSNDLSQCLDVLAHEYTHCVTGSLMTYNLYTNDYGAINEALSDIQGKTCQMLLEGKENATWELADRSREAVRSFSEPHRYQQPQFTWDLYYIPNAKTPTVLNDLGGVHTNSSLLNAVAWQLYEKAGMTLEEGRAFWFAVACAMVPGTDYPQLCELLPWALRTAGLEQYDTALRRALDSTRMGVGTLPDTLDADRALLTLALPENQAFDDEQWVLYVFSAEPKDVLSAVLDAFGRTLSGDFSGLPAFAQRLLSGLLQSDGEGGWLSALLNLFPEEDEGESRETDFFGQMEAELEEWALELLRSAVYMAGTNAGQDGRTMRMVARPGYALPVLIHGVYNQATDDLDNTCLLVYVGGAWTDLGALLEAGNGDEAAFDAGLQTLLDRVAQRMENADSLNGILESLLMHVPGGSTCQVPSTGLEEIAPAQMHLLDDAEIRPEDTPVPRKSRPKLDSVPAPAPDAAPDEKNRAA